MMRLCGYREAEHYALLHEGWIGHAMEPALPADLPGDARPGAGFLVLQDPGWLAAGFVYATGTRLWLGPHYLMVNPMLRETEGGKAAGNIALNLVVQAIERYVALKGGGALGTFSDQPPVVARARRLGYELRGRLPLLGKQVPSVAPTWPQSGVSHG